MPHSSHAAAFTRPSTASGLHRPAWTEPLTGLDEPSLWPSEVLEAFSLRMMLNGHCVSSGLMQRDRRYALSQLAHANNLNDDVLQELSRDLFRHFEQRQSGVPRFN